MAVRPEIALQGRMTDVGQTFSNALLNVSRISQLAQQAKDAPLRARILEAQAQTTEAGVPTQEARFNARQQQIIKSLGVAGQQIIPDLQAGNITNVISSLQRRKLDLEREGLPTDETDEAIQLAQTNPGELLTRSQQAVELASQIIPAKTGASARAFAPQTDPVTGEQSSIVFSPETESFTRTVIPGAKQLTPSEKAKLGVESVALEERAKLTEKRASTIKQELSERNRNAARSARTTRKALTLAKTASQGLSGSTKLRLSRLVPGIDVTDEAGLDSALKELSLQQLQNFKGPTTDFEFGVTEAITGTIGNSQSANEARIKSLDRANWFNQREQSQFTKHVGSGGDPDTFRFNFGEPIRTKKGVFTLQDIQDTAVQNTLTIEETIKSLNR